MPQPFLSVVIPTLHRYPRLAQTLQCAAESEYPSFEVIVVDQTRPSEFNSSNWPALNLRYIRLEQPNLPAARNVGIHAARGEIVLFIDDDVTFGPEFFTRHVEAHAAHSNVGAVTGRIQLLPPHYWPDLNGVAFVNPRTAKFQANFGYDREGLVDYPCGCNVSFKRTALQTIGPFDDHFIGNALYEEIDYACRLQRFGLPIFFEPKAQLIHHREPSGGTRLQRKIRYDAEKFYNTAYFYFKQLDAKKPGEFLKASKNEIEFYTRRKGGHHWVNAAVYCAALLLGGLRGLLNRPMDAAR